MAEKAVTSTRLGDEAMLLTWAAMSESDTGAKVDLSDYPIRCGQITGDLGSGDQSWEGSNDGTNFTILKDVFGTAATVSTAGELFQLGELPRYVRPKTPTGSSVASVPTLHCKRWRGD